MTIKPWMLLGIGATLDLAVAAALWLAGLHVFGAFMGVVAVVGYGLALWIRGRSL